MSAGPAQSAATRRALPITITLLVVLMFFPPSKLGWVGWFGDLATVVTAPISHPSTKFATWIDPARDHRDDATLEQLREDRDTAMYQAQAAQEQVRELERIIRDLQDSIEYIEQRNVTPLYASVIGASADLSSRNLTVKRGANAGVQPNTVAVVHVVQLVGLVIDVSPKTCTVRPVTDKASGRVEGRIIFDDDGNGLACSLSPTGEGTLRGDVGAIVGDRAIEPEKITLGMRVRLDDNAWPQNAQMLVLGTVELIEDDPDKGLRKIITVRPTIEIERVKEVTLQLVRDEEDGINKAALAIVAWLALGLQLGLTPALELGSRGVAPSFVIPLIVVIALFAPPRVARWSALLIGLMIDLTATVGGSPTLVGPYAIAMLIVAEFVMSIRSVVMGRNPITVGMLSLVGALIAGVFIVAIYTVRKWLFGDPAWSPASELVVRAGSAVYTGVVAIGVALLLLPISGIFGLSDDNRRAAIGRRG